jgi:DNA-binding LacI/PurR family transcriptional regulator
MLSAGATTPVGLRSRRLIDQLEGECARTGLSLEMLAIDSMNEYAGLQEHLGRRKNKTILGYIVDLQWIELQRPKHFMRVLRQIESGGMPVAILDQTGEFTLPPPLAIVPHVRLFRCAAITAGRQVGRILLSHGHEKIAYISHQHQAQWSQDRCAGLGEPFAKAGFSDAVIPVVSNQIGGYCERVFGAAGLDRKDFLRLIRGLEEESQYTEAFKSDEFDSLANSFVATNAGTARIIHAAMVRFSELAGEPLDPVFHKRAQRAFFDAVTESIIGAEMDRLFEKAFATAGISAWVAATDGTAVAAGGFLRKHGVDIPADLSLVGFDNSFIALDHRVSSYDFNVPLLVQTMLDFIHDPLRFNRRFSDAPMEVEGYFVLRDTLGRNRARPSI